MPVVTLRNRQRSSHLATDVPLAAEYCSSPSKKLITKQIRSLGRVAETSGIRTHQTIGTALAEWCKLSYPALPKSSLPRSTELAQLPQLRKFVATLQQLPFLDAIYWLSSAYAMLAEDSYRKKLAMFFTPSSIAKGLLDDLATQGVDFGAHSFVDPACGGAAFLTPIAIRMRDNLKARRLSAKQILQHVENNLYGVDLDFNLCELSKQFLCMALYDEIRSTACIPKFKIDHADSLSHLTSKLGEMDVVVCNPPYRKMLASELEPLRQIFPEIIEAQPNLYGLFIGLSIRILRPGGYAALVTPTSFLSGNYFSKLRQFIAHETDVKHIGVVSDRIRVFIDVEQETALTILKRRNSVARACVATEVSAVSSLGEYIVRKCIRHAV